MFNVDTPFHHKFRLRTTHLHSDSGLSPKSLPALFAVWYGWPGAILAVGLLCIASLGAIRVAQRIDSPFSLCCILAAILSLALFSPGIFQYELALVIGFCLFAARLPGGLPWNEDHVNSATDSRA